LPEPSESAYDQARKALEDAIEYLPVGGALPDEGEPIPYAQVCATVGLGQAILALRDELIALRDELQNRPL